MFFNLGYWLRNESGLFRWVLDEEGDLGLAVFGGLIVFVKYKDFVVVEWFKWHLEDAPKYLN